MVYSVPMPCERCGSIRTMLMKLDPFHSDKLNPNKPLEKQLCYYSIYESIWKRIGRPDIDGTPDEQYRTGMMFLNGEAWSMRNSEVAFYWFMKAAKRGHAQAQYQVGAMLDRMRYRYKYDKISGRTTFLLHVVCGGNGLPMDKQSGRAGLTGSDVLLGKHVSHRQLS